MNRISETDFILNPDGSAYHLKLQRDEIAGTIITVGDPGRVEKVSKYFDKIELKKSNREFITHTGFIGKNRISVISTGIGTDNIDIVVNELDALVNIDRHTRIPYPAPKSLNLIRIGTSGALQPDIQIDSLLVSSEAIGIDSLMHYYAWEMSEREELLLADFKSAVPAAGVLNPYASSANQWLSDQLASDSAKGITITAPGFYAPQGRQLRAVQSFPDLLPLIMKATICGDSISNLEMETAGLYGLTACLGHKALSFNIILANRATNTFSANPDKVINFHIKKILEVISDKIQ
jgi:uridine phosphorylase